MGDLTTQSKKVPKKNTRYILPSGNWTTLLRDVPKSFTAHKIDTYTSEKEAMKHHQRGYNFFKSKKVKQLLMNFSEFIYLKGTVEASYKTKVKYTVSVVVERNGTIKDGFCACKAGRNGVCSHVCALLWCLLDAKYSGKTVIHIKKLACTDEQCKWNVPSQTPNQVAKSSADLIYKKHVPGKDSKSHIHHANRRKRRDALKPVVNPALLKEYHTKLTESNQNSMLCDVLKSHDFQPLKLKEPPCVDECDSQTEELLPINVPVEVLWELEVEKLQEIKPFKMEKITLQESWQIQKETIDQSSCEQWGDQRIGKPTASKFGLIYNRNLLVDQKFIQNVFNKSKFNQTKYMTEGLINEDFACQKYLDENQYFKAYKCGFCRNVGFPCVGASPDRVVYDFNLGAYILLEIKTLSKAKELKLGIRDAILQKRCTFLHINKEGKIQLKIKSNHYIQIQGQLAITGLEFCDLIVDSGVDHYIERVPFNRDFWVNSLMPKLYNFCADHLHKLQ